MGVMDRRIVYSVYDLITLTKKSVRRQQYFHFITQLPWCVDGCACVFRYMYLYDLALVLLRTVSGLTSFHVGVGGYVLLRPATRNSIF